jgi:hypothetical protein
MDRYTPILDETVSKPDDLDNFEQQGFARFKSAIHDYDQTKPSKGYRYASF